MQRKKRKKKIEKEEHPLEGKSVKYNKCERAFFSRTTQKQKDHSWPERFPTMSSLKKDHGDPWKSDVNSNSRVHAAESVSETFSDLCEFSEEVTLRGSSCDCSMSRLWVNPWCRPNFTPGRNKFAIKAKTWRFLLETVTKVKQSARYERKREINFYSDERSN